MGCKNQPAVVYYMNFTMLVVIIWPILWACLIAGSFVRGFRTDEGGI